MTSLKENYQELTANINRLIEKCPEASNEIETICVSKYASLQQMSLLYDLGVRHFGENRPLIFKDKYDALKSKDQIIWHFIGQLQSRMVKTIINQIDYLHSLDRLSLAKEIQKRADHPVKCFLQVNISGEASKSGINPDQIDSFIEDIQIYDKLQIIGLMTMAPYEAQEAELLDIFNQLRQLRDDIQAKNILDTSFKELSMGMTRDYPQAIACGATYLRIGSAFFKNIEN